MRDLPSPLAAITSDPLVHQFVAFLQDARARILAAPGEVHELRVSRSRAAEVAHSFQRTVRRGEERLHRLARLLADTLYQGPHELRSVVVGAVPSTGERFLIQQPLTVGRLYGLTDLDLGQRLIRAVRLEGPDGWEQPRLVANAVEYLPVEENPFHVHKIISRIKAEEEVWEKVVDELFDLDALVRRDKQLRHLSRFVKDVFGLKIVLGSTSDAPRLQRHIEALAWTDEELAEHRVPIREDTRRLVFLETKDYLSRAGRKQSGFMALKSVVTFWERPFEIQLQPLRNYYRERERITKESHGAHMQRREELRTQLAEHVPLMGFVRALLRWLFAGEGEPPRDPAVRLVIEE